MAELFSYDNYRKALVSQAADYIWILRDEALMNKGIYITIKIPDEENNINEYSDFIDEREDYHEIQTFIEPQFDKYIMTLSLLGQDMERDYPLKVNIMSQVHIPKNSIMLIPEINSEGSIITREWRVLSTEIKQVGHIYTRVANCTPARSFEKIVTDIVEPKDYSELEVLDCTVTKGEDIWDIPIETFVGYSFEALDVLVYEPYGLVVAEDTYKITAVSPIILH